jgi:hypothetical protein
MSVVVGAVPKPATTHCNDNTRTYSIGNSPLLCAKDTMGAGMGRKRWWPDSASPKVSSTGRRWPAGRALSDRRWGSKSFGGQQSSATSARAKAARGGLAIRTVNAEAALFRFWTVQPVLKIGNELLKAFSRGRVRNQGRAAKMFQFHHQFQLSANWSVEHCSEYVQWASGAGWRCLSPSLERQFYDASKSVKESAAPHQ